MKRLLFIAAAICVMSCGRADFARSDDYQGAPRTTTPNLPNLPVQSVNPASVRSYNLNYTPYLGGAYRYPDAYLPVYPGYAPYWQTPSDVYSYGYWPQYYGYPQIYSPVYSPLYPPVNGPGRHFGPRGGWRK
jgi:hypothetical protein